MATLYVEGVPADLYEALRQQAGRNRRSIAAETVSILRQAVPTEAELRRRADFLRRLDQIGRRTSGAGLMPAAEELVRQDRRR